MGLGWICRRFYSSQSCTKADSALLDAYHEMGDYSMAERVNDQADSDAGTGASKVG